MSLPAPIRLYLAVIALAYVRANALLAYWTWFAVPIGAPEIVSLWHALGLSGLLNVSSIRLFAPTDDKPFFERQGFALAFYLLAWGLGYFYASMMPEVAL